MPLPVAEPAIAAALEDAGPSVRVGCAGVPHGISRDTYFSRLDFLETDATFIEPPADSALRRWRRDAPDPAAFGTLAWQLITHEPGTPGYAHLRMELPLDARARVGGFRGTAEVAAAWVRTRDAALALGAEVILFQTPSSFSPSSANRDAMRRFFGDVVGDARGMRLAWEPRGVWEPAAAAAFAAELGLVLALDPLQLETDAPKADELYLRIQGLGLHRNRVSEDQLDVLAELVSGLARSWVVFANVEKYRDAQHFRKMLAGLAFVDRA
ncbi:MAG: DUF72 domain-containing protein [Myxococcales bacterium]|nr:DUF72 domain-containing protein [Myxococcales bacterium]